MVSVVNTRDDDVEILTQQVASAFVERLGAPNLEVARAAAGEEIAFMAELCLPHEAGTLLTISREIGENGITESFRSLPKADSCAEQKIWTVVEDDMPVDAG